MCRHVYATHECGATPGPGGMAAASAASGMGLAVLGKRAGTAREYGGRNLAVGAVLGEGRVRGLSKRAAGRQTGSGGFLGGRGGCPQVRALWNPLWD